MKYIDIKIVGHSFIRAFENKNKKQAKHPDFTSNGVAVWIKESKKKAE